MVSVMETGVSMIRMKKNKKLKISLINLLISSVKATPFLSFMVIFFGVLFSVSWAANTMFMQRLFDTATSMVNNKSTINLLILDLVILGAVNIFNQIVNCFGNISQRYYQTKLTGFFSGLFHEKIRCLSAQCFENIDMLNDMNKAKKGKDSIAFTMLIVLLLIGFYLPFLLFMFFYFFSLQPLLAVILPIAFIPTILLQFLRTKAYFKLEDKSAPFRRENEYYAKCITSREYFKETRLLGGVHYFRKRYLETQKLLNQAIKQTEVRISKQEALYKLLTILGYFLTLTLMFYLLIKKEITIGAFAAIFASMRSLYSLIDEIISYNIAHVSKELGSISYFMNFVNSPIPVGNVEKLSTDNIVVENISFSYPNIEKKVINNISFSIQKGETIAIVGQNGSGKTTLVKLLIGLYFPDSGTVKYDDIDNRQFSPDSISLNISSVFQTFQKYQMTLRDNLEISQLGKHPDDNYIGKVLDNAGISLDQNKFPDGYDTMLSREFNGTDLSGGEWQRIAIARGLYRDHDIIVLDEPTSSIDPIEEAATYKRFAEITANKTVLIVTHRLGSVKFADKILVMKEGEIVEIGTHSELLEKNGEYAYIFKSQSQWYQ